MHTSSLMSPAKTSSLTKNKFDHTNPRKNLQIVEDNFFKWSNDNMYRTSTHDMSDKVSGKAVCLREPPPLSEGQLLRSYTTSLSNSSANQ